MKNFKLDYWPSYSKTYCYPYPVSNQKSYLCGSCRAWLSDIYAYLFNNDKQEEIDNFEFIYHSDHGLKIDLFRKYIGEIEKMLDAPASEFESCLINDQENNFVLAKPSEFWKSSPESLSLFTLLIRNVSENSFLSKDRRGVQEDEINKFIPLSVKFKNREKGSWVTSKNENLSFYTNRFHENGIARWVCKQETEKVA